MNPTLHALLPKKALSAGMYKIARIKTPWFAQFAIRTFMTATGANLDGAQRSKPEDYESLLDFFTRALAADARPITAEKSAIACPVDGRVAHVGDIENDQIFQIKGHSYSLTQLLGEDIANDYLNGQAATIYLAPFDYHRIHAPLAGKLQRAKYIPGELNSVSITLLDKIAGLFAKNERVVLEFITDSGTPYVMVLVGAVNVGSIETVFHGEVCPNDFGGALDIPAKGESVEKGEEVGRFNLGSTVILIAPNASLTWELTAGQKTQMGERIGEWL